MILAGVIGGLLLLALVAVMGIWLVRDRKQTAKNSADRERNESFDHPDEYAKGKQSYGATWPFFILCTTIVYYLQPLLVFKYHTITFRRDDITVPARY